VVLAVVSTLATVLISLFIWCYDRRSVKRKERHEKELRLQEHNKLLSSTDAMHRIDEFKQQCADMFKDLPPEQRPSYGAVFRYGRPITRNGVCITKETLSSVDTARKELQGIWDNICGDFKGGRLPGSITDSSNGRMLNRALTYLEAAEPLESGNRGRMEDRGHVNATPPYLISFNAAAAGQPGSNSAAAAAVQPGSTPDDAAEQHPTFYHGVRPSRFFWIEDQQAMQLIEQNSACGSAGGSGGGSGSCSCCGLGCGGCGCGLQNRWRWFCSWINNTTLVKWIKGFLKHLKKAPPAVKLWTVREKTAAGQYVRKTEEAVLQPGTWGTPVTPQTAPAGSQIALVGSLTSEQRKAFCKRWKAVEAAYIRLHPALLPPPAAEQQANQGSSAAGTGSSSCAAAGPSTELAQLVAKQNVLLERLLGLMQQQWPEAAAAARSSSSGSGSHSSSTSSTCTSSTCTSCRPCSSND
jgi:hypothetical protein